MNDTVSAALPLTSWQGEKATYHLVIFTGPEAEALAGHALMQRLEFGRRAGFGSIKVTARIGATAWKTSVFPQKHQSQWVLLIGKKVMRAEGLAPGDTIEVAVTPV
ncbi:DUF1905 domain-containing protein [Qipengyuania sp. ASV99]|uniref:DUF1905 domain-containing protein n=1 Tax=Qipengyuania sp. ASV99 TaxID=3399681 RepID=UPI003A4C5202